MVFISPQKMHACWQNNRNLRIKRRLYRVGKMAPHGQYYLEPIGKVKYSEGEMGGFFRGTIFPVRAEYYVVYK